MTSPASSTRYTPVRRDSEDPSSHLHLPPTMNNRVQPRSYAVAVSAILVVRILAAILCLVAFIILVVDGGPEFIAADIFVMAVLILNVLCILHYTISDVFKVTVELRQQAWSGELRSSSTKKVSDYFDYGLSMGLLLCLIIGSGVKDRWDGGGAWKGAVVIGYFIVLLQILMAISLLKSWTLSIKLSESRGKVPLDTKVPDVVDDSERGSARRRAPESAQEQPQSAEDLV